MRDIILIVLTPAALTLGAVIGSRRHHLDWRVDLGLQKPAAASAVFYSALFLMLAASYEFLYWKTGGDGASSDWRARYHGAGLLMRVLFAAAIYPLAEELFFRGFLLALIRGKGGAIVAVLASSIAFTALHSLGGTWLGTAQIFTDGMFFAVARLRSGSLYLPMAFHVAGNTLAVVQRLI